MPQLNEHIDAQPVPAIPHRDVEMSITCCRDDTTWLLRGVHLFVSETERTVMIHFNFTDDVLPTTVFICKEGQLVER